MRLTFPVFLQIEGLLFRTPAGLVFSTASCKLSLQYMKVVICHQVGWKRFLLSFWPWSSVYLVNKFSRDGACTWVSEGSGGKRNNFEDCDT